MKAGSIVVVGISIAYVASRGTKPGALLLHGNSSSRESFAAVLEGELGATRRLVAVDLPGHGASGWAEETHAGRYSMGWFARIAAGAARALDLDNACVVGHSLGAHVALRAASDRLLPDAKGLFLEGLAPLASPTDVASAMHPAPIGPTMANGRPSPNEIVVALEYLYGPHTAPPEHAVRAFEATDPVMRPVFMESVIQGENRDELAALRSLEVPVALVHAADDLIVNGDWLASRDVPKRWRGGVHTVAHAGHYAHEEQSTAWEELLGRFLDETLVG